MTAILQWNMGCGTRAQDAPCDATMTQRVQLLNQMLKIRAPSVIALQEAPDALESGTPLLRDYAIRRSRRNMVTAFRTSDWTPSAAVYNEDVSRYATWSTATFDATGDTLDFVNVHLPSRAKEDNPESTLRGILRGVSESRYSFTDAVRTIWVGDFNMDPWAEEFVSPEYLCAGRCPDTSARLAKGPHESPSPMFSPSWSLVGSHGKPRGTYYYEAALKERRFSGEPWHVFDLIALPIHYATSDCHSEIISSVGTCALSTGSAPHVPEATIGSDHFPVITFLSL